MKIHPVVKHGLVDLRVELESSDLKRQEEKPTFDVGDRFKANEKHWLFRSEVEEEFREDCQGVVISIHRIWPQDWPGSTMYTLQTSRGWFQCFNMDWAKKAIKLEED